MLYLPKLAIRAKLGLRADLSVVQRVSSGVSFYPNFVQIQSKTVLELFFKSSHVTQYAQG